MTALSEKVKKSDIFNTFYEMIILSKKFEKDSVRTFDI